MHFILRLNLTDHQHPENRAAEHAKVRELLGLAMQAVGSSPKRNGELKIPRWDVSRGVNEAVTIGSWEFIEDETRNPDPEA